MMASWAIIKFHCACCVNCQTPVNLVSVPRRCPNCGIYPQFSLNGAYPVVELMLLLSATQRLGNVLPNLSGHCELELAALGQSNDWHTRLHHPFVDGMLWT